VRGIRHRALHAWHHRRAAGRALLIEVHLEDQQKLSAIVKKVHFQHYPTELLTDLAAFAGSGSAEFDLLRSCEIRVIGLGLEKERTFYCCVHCAEEYGKTGFVIADGAS